MRHQPHVRRCKVVIGSSEGPGVGSWFVVDVEGEDGIWDSGWGGNDSSMEGVKGSSYALCDG
jgi:hypothetical protein